MKNALIPAGRPHNNVRQLRQPSLSELLALAFLEKSISYVANIMQEAAADSARNKDLRGFVLASALAALFAYTNQELQNDAQLLR